MRFSVLSFVFSYISKILKLYEILGGYFFWPENGLFSIILSNHLQRVEVVLVSGKFWTLIPPNFDTNKLYKY